MTSPTEPKAERKKKEKGQIEMTTIAFYRGEIPREIALRDCSLPIQNGPVTAFCAYYGEKSNQSGFMAARQYAASLGLQYTVIDIEIQLRPLNPSVMKPEELEEFDFLNFARMSREMRSVVSKWFSEPHPSAGGTAEPSETRSAIDAVAANPSLVDKLIALPECSHLKVIAFQAVTSLATMPLTVGGVPHRHWSAIRSANCRLNPTVRVLLDAPGT